MDNLLESSTILLYSDKRVDLENEAYKYAKIIFEKKEISYVKEDVKYFENIKISDCRDIIEFATKSSYNGLKIFILNFDNIRNEASNALLKIIEEPPKNTYFLLLSTSINKILPTILSRCIKIYIKPNNINVDDKVYRIFDGNMKYINEYIEKNINLDEYLIRNLNDAIEYIEKYNLEEINIYLFIHYQMALNYLITDAKFETKYEKFIFIEKLINIYSNSRDKSVELLNRLSILLAFKVDKKTYNILINLKNSIKNNVNLRMVLYIFLCIILEEV